MGLRSTQFEIGEISAVADDERAGITGVIKMDESAAGSFAFRKNPLQTFSTRYCELGDNGT